MNPTNGRTPSLFLLPGHELDSFPRELENSEADALLAGWLSLWHPSLLVATQAIPTWHPAGQPASEVGKTVIVVPEIAKSELEESFKSKDGDQVVLEPKPGWRAFQSELLTAARIDVDSTFEARWTEEFAALGYAYLQIQLMTRQLRYTSNLDQVLFGAQAVEAAEAAVAGDTTRAEELLQSCFDTLGQERDHYYSLDVSLLDVTLLAESTLGKSLKTQLETLPIPTTYVASASLLEAAKAKSLDTFELLKRRLKDTDALAGGLDTERPSPLMTRESWWRDLDRGGKAYERLELERPKVFARMTFGMTADHSAELKRFGYEGALLTAWSEGAYPEGSQSKLSWESSDGTCLSAIATKVLDASDASSFLSLGWSVGDALDHQHVPAVVFAHWPGRSHELLHLVQCVAKRTPALGRWMNAKEYFESTDEPYHQERLSVGGFKFNWLAKSDAPNKLISATEKFHNLAARCCSLTNLLNLIWQLEHRPKPASPTTKSDGQDSPLQENLAASESSAEGATAPEIADQRTIKGGLSELALPELEKLLDLADSILDDTNAAADIYAEATQLAELLTDQVLQRARHLLAPTSTGDGTGETVGRLILNPQSQPNRIRVQSDAHQIYASESWNYCTGRVGHDRYTCVDVPSHGFVVAPIEGPEPRAKMASLAQMPGLVQNEFLEAQIDTSRGHLRSLYVPAVRGNRLSAMIARRDRMPDGSFSYSEMKATDVRMLTSSNVCGLIRATGRLEKDGSTLGNFEIDYEAWRGSRILEIAIRLRDLVAPVDINPWKSAYVLRIAWPSESAILRTVQGGRRHQWTGGRAVSPSLIEIDEADYRTHYLPAGLAFHRQTEARFLETVLVAAPAKEDFEHRVGLAVDLPSPLGAAQDFMDRRYSIPLKKDGGKLAASHGWMVSADVKNVKVDLESPLRDEHGNNVGLRLFLTETAGRSTSTTIRLMYPVELACRVDAFGRELGKLTALDDGFKVAVRADEHCYVDVLWK